MKQQQIINYPSKRTFKRVNDRSIEAAIREGKVSLYCVRVIENEVCGAYGVYLAQRHFEYCESLWMSHQFHDTLDITGLIKIGRLIISHYNSVLSPADKRSEFYERCSSMPTMTSELLVEAHRLENLNMYICYSRFGNSETGARKVAAFETIAATVWQYYVSIANSYTNPHWHLIEDDLPIELKSNMARLRRYISNAVLKSSPNKSSFYSKEACVDSEEEADWYNGPVSSDDEVVYSRNGPTWK